MATSTLGSLDPFDAAKEDWSAYTERFEQFILANGVEGEKKIVATFLTIVGSKTYNLLRDLLAPEKPSSRKYAELIEVLQKHYEPKPLVIAERFHFHKRDQKEGETVSDYSAALKKASERCEFKGFLEEALRDRFVCGLRNRNIQRKLLAEKDLTWDKAFEVAQAMESAERQANKFGGIPAEERVNALKSRSRGLNKQRRFEKKEHGKPCFRCGEQHLPQTCRFKNEQCHHCKGTGHISKVCKKKSANHKKDDAKPQNSGFRYLQEAEHDHLTHEFGELFQIGNGGNSSEPSIIVPVSLNGVPLNMELDTGASVTVISEETLRNNIPNVELSDSNVRLKTYTGEELKIVGQTVVNVQYENQECELPIQVIQGNGPALLGRNWLRNIRLNWGTIKRISEDLDDVLTKHREVFKDELGTMCNVKAKLHVKAGSTPKFYKPRSVPHALKGAIEKELDRLESMGVIEKVRYSEWAAPIVAVVKPDNSLRLCGDYKVTINSALEVDQHPLPNPEELFVTLSGGQKFSKLDLSRAYQQILLDEESREYVTINTHKGLYRPKRLPFGVASASAIFQSKVEQILQGIPMVVCRVDDILVSGKNDQDHLRNLAEVLTRLESAGLRLKLAKCKFMQHSVEYLGYRVDANGLHAIEKKVEAIRNAPAPGNQQQLRSFLGMVNYYAKFVNNYATITHPLNELLHNGVRWKWGHAQEKAFTELKNKLSRAPVLVHYNVELPLKLDTDASNYGVGAVISHVFPNGEERPIAFASRTLNKSECNYAQIEKEALSIIFGIKKFHQYLYGRKFLLVTDHKPLVSLLGPKAGIPTLAAARMQRWALLLSAYQYDIVYRSTNKHANADCLSRLPLQNVDRATEVDEVKMINKMQIQSLTLGVDHVRNATRADPVLSRVLKFTLSGWPEETTSEALKPYFHKRYEITTEDGCLLWGIRVIIPKILHEQVLTELHEGHPGIVRMKSLSRLHVW